MLKKLYLSLVIFVAVVVWLFQSSISTFWPQDRNLTNPISSLEKYEEWTIGAKVNHELLKVRTYVFLYFNHLSYNLTYFVANDLFHNPQAFSHELTALQEEYKELVNQLANLQQKDLQNIPMQNSHVVQTRDDDHSTLNEVDEPQNSKINDAASANLPNNIVRLTLKANEYILGNLDGYAGNVDYSMYGARQTSSQIKLNSSDRVLLIGDSMQQGVGRHIRSWLQTTYKIEANNLAKQSTGFVNPKNLDWNDTVRNELAHNSYRLLIVLIGANDTYGLTEPTTGQIYKFGTQGWKAHYAQRVMSVLYEARSHGLDVIWILGPAMKSTVANEKIKIVNQIYIDAVKQYGGIILNADRALGYPDGQFASTQTIDGQVKKIRANDGTHFTITGEKLIAHAVQKHIIFEQSSSQAVIPLPKSSLYLAE